MTASRQYIDFTLELRDLNITAHSFIVALTSSKEFGEPPPISVPYGYDELEDALGKLEEKYIDQEALINLGKQLTNRLLPAGDIRDAFTNAVKKVGQDSGIRLRLVIREPKLAQLPWEYCYLPIFESADSRHHFLVINPQISIVRHIPLAKEWPSIQPANPNHLRLAVVMANPIDPHFSELSLKVEKRAIQNALGSFNVDGITIEWKPVLENATPDELKTALLRKADLFHFAGHGEFAEQDVDPETNEPIGAGNIILVGNKTTRPPSPLSASDLAHQLQAAGVRLAVLGACDSGRHDGVSPWAGVAPALVGRGLPAVVAMQYEVVDGAATAFNQMFYTALATGLSVDESISAGRLAMLGDGDEKDVEWGVPVLYMRAGDGLIFPQLAKQKSEAREHIRHVIRQEVKNIKKGGIVKGAQIKQVVSSLLHEQKATNVAGTLEGPTIDEL